MSENRLEQRWWMRLIHFFLKPDKAIRYALAVHGEWICPCLDCKALEGQCDCYGKDALD